MRWAALVFDGPASHLASAAGREIYGADQKLNASMISTSLSRNCEDVAEAAPDTAATG